MHVFFPSVAKDNAHFVEVEGRNDYVTGDELGAGALLGIAEFVPLKKGHSVLLELHALDRQFDKVVITFDIGGVVHKEH